MQRQIEDQIEYWNLEIERFYIELPSVIDNGDQAMLARMLVFHLEQMLQQLESLQNVE